jgi:hypothetical protein
LSRAKHTPNPILAPPGLGLATKESKNNIPNPTLFPKQTVQPCVVVIVVVVVVVVVVVFVVFVVVVMLVVVLVVVMVVVVVCGVCVCVLLVGYS